jgi:hypothetical protein
MSSSISFNKSTKVRVTPCQINTGPFMRSIKSPQNVQKYNFSYVPYGSGTWSVTLREEKRLKVFENRMLRRIFG